MSSKINSLFPQFRELLRIDGDSLAYAPSQSLRQIAWEGECDRVVI